jgi:hypothetical protein
VLITKEYKDLQEELHKDPNYGVASVGYAPLVANIIESARIVDLMDYGCGKKRLFQALNGKVSHKMRLQAYDPAIPECAGDPLPAQMVTCIDVLEHIEPDLLDNVLNDLERLTLELGFFTVSTEPARKVLADGRNAHLIQQPAEWWLPKIIERFELHTFQRNAGGFYVIVYPREKVVLS